MMIFFTILNLAMYFTEVKSVLPTDNTDLRTLLTFMHGRISTSDAKARLKKRSGGLTV